ncbi:helix-turn-helix domain-containing protein [Pelagibacterium xiamenense]|uniref:helix-turn-helix domain-containing protein n=1 Tax=Pelagibacterium xiamenense TaxID=2901140 RepID=UPI001E4545C2|nr:AraC family transcriptional regulator [Pelagibacterium xiamenense]MCD7060615.1 AraC family transcriptional regulator [Pelagibacterium xiamenense]
MEGADYFTYLPENTLCEAWGCTALSTGYTAIPPGSDYPPVRHPDDHHFVWEKGRTLQAYQFALISEGRGRLQAAPQPDVVRTVEAGDVILLFPGVWHRFSPDPETGWVEHWIECRGFAFDRAMDMELLPTERPLWHAGKAGEAIFNTVHRLAREDALLHQPELSTLGLQLLARLCQSRDLAEQGRARIVERARRILMEQSGRSPALAAVARDLGISYSTLRRLFRQHTGISLKQYQTEVRIRRACELLRNSDKSIKEIAGHLGYNSAFHFSTQFQKATGVAPSHWRQRNHFAVR